MAYVITSGVFQDDPPAEYVTATSDGKVYTREWILANREQYIRDAEEAMKQRFLDALHRSSSPALMFFARIVKRTAIMAPAASVVWEPMGIWLAVDATFSLCATKEEFEWVLTHELLHITSNHMSRQRSLAENLSMRLGEFAKSYGKYTDLPINKTLEKLGMGSVIDMSSILTYDTAGIPPSIETYEKIVEYVIKNEEILPKIDVSFLSGQQDLDDIGDGEPSKNTKKKEKSGDKDSSRKDPSEDDDPNEADADQEENPSGRKKAGIKKDQDYDPDSGDPDEGDVRAGDEDSGSCNEGEDGTSGCDDEEHDDEDGSSEYDKLELDENKDVKLDGESRIPVSIPADIMSKDIENNLKEIVRDVIEEMESQGVRKDAGTVAGYLLKTLRDMEKDLSTTMVDRTIANLEACLRLTAANARKRRRTTRRLNRHTGLPPGRRRDISYDAMFYIDESGSMTNDEVRMCYEFVRKASASRKSDRLYVCHWDTEPADKIDVVLKGSDIGKITRHKTGGTVFRDMFSNPLVMEKKVDARIIVTDGMVYGWPDPSSREPEIWLITTRCGYDTWKEYGQGTAFCIQDVMEEMKRSIGRT